MGLLEECQRNVRGVSGQCQGVSRKCQGCVRVVYGKYQVSIWDMSRKCQVIPSEFQGGEEGSISIRRVRSNQTNIREIPGKCQKSVSRRDGMTVSRRRGDSQESVRVGLGRSQGGKGEF